MTGFDNERFDKLAVEASTVLDTEKRKGIYVEIARIGRDEGAFAIVAHPQSLDAVSSTI